MRTFAAFAGLPVFCAMAFALNAHAQDTNATLVFEVASVKPSPPPNGRGYSVSATGVPGSPYGKDPGRFHAENFSIPNLITMAYDIPYYRLSGADNLHTIIFDVEARMPTDTTKAQFGAMLQNLLAERFHLKVHWVTRQIDMYELAVAKGGSKLKEGAPDPAPADDDTSRRKNDDFAAPKRGPDGYPTPPPGNQPWMAIMGSKAFMRRHNATGAEMADAFSGQVGAPVTDATGLTGKYDFSIFWSTAATRGLPATPGDAAEPDGPSLFQAIQEQLGLKLEAKKGPVQVLVVDHVDTTPTGN